RHARAAGRAGVQVDDHAPGMVALGMRRMERGVRFGLALLPLEEPRVLAEAVDRPDAHRLAPLHAVVLLRRGELAPLAGPREAHAPGRPRRLRGPQRVRVEPRALADAPALPPTVAEVHEHAVV